MKQIKLQQGDVVLKSIVDFPDGVRKIEKRHVSGHVLAEGEVTGHAHIIDDTKTELYEKDGILYLGVAEETDLKHLKGNSGVQAEHNPTTVTPGKWKVNIVREFDAFEEEVRKVQD